MIEILLSAIIGYFSGSIFLSYFLCLSMGHDITKEGTGQLGASNTGRLIGWPFMILTGLFDILKATISLYTVQLMFNGIFNSIYYDAAIICCSCGLLLGHIRSFWIWLYKREWHGGKGGAPLAGIILFISWVSFVILYVVIMVNLQIGKKLLKNNIKFYENFYANIIIAIIAPFIILIFTKNLLFVGLILFLEGIISYFEKEKFIKILSTFKGRNVKNNSLTLKRT